MRLRSGSAELLVSHPFLAGAAVHALLALMYFNLARLPARIDPHGVIFTLAEQDRSRWDQSKIARGVAHLELSGAGSRIGRYHLEAGIAACHTLSASDAVTDWRRILGLYDDLLALDASPVVALNRAVALARVEGRVRG